VFNGLADQIEAMEDREEAEHLKQWVIGFAVETDIDRQGRVLLPPQLRRRIKFGGTAVLMGQIRRFDLWPEDEWNARFDTGADGVAASAPVAAFRKLKR
jgi:MraZ protein